MKYRLLLTLLAMAMVPAYAQVSGTGKVAATPGTTAASGSTLPLEAQSGISAVLGRDDSSYEITSRAGSFEAANPPQQLSAEFKPGSVRIHTGDADLGMSLLAYGYGDTLQSVPGAVPHASLNRVEYRRGSLTEWYVNGPAGLEQGFTLDAPPAQKRTGPLTIALALSGGLAAAPQQSGGELTLKDRNKTDRLHYAGLNSYDATGKQLRTWMEVRGGQLRLKVEDTGAVYPVVVDPWLYAKKVLAADGQAYDYFGNSVSVSSDGSMVVIGAFQATVNSNYEQGAVYVFVKPKAGWKKLSKFTAKLTASDGAAGDSFGTSVAISADAKTIVVGAPTATIGSNSEQGAVYVYVRPPTGPWKTTDQFTAKLTAADGNANDWLGWSVSYNGSAVVAGADQATVGSNVYQGAAYVFVKPKGGWTSGTQNAKLTSSDGAALDQFGYCVSNSSSSTGNTVVIGAIDATVGVNEQQGAAYVFVEPKGGWTGTLNENAKLTAKAGFPADQFGSSAVISSDAATIAVGAEGANVAGNAEQGAVYVFAEPTGGWTGPLNETAELTASDGNQEDYFGFSVAMNSLAKTIVVGAPFAPFIGGSPGGGRAYVYAKPKTGGWVTTSTFTQELKASDGRIGAEFGNAVGIASHTLVVGAFATCNPVDCYPKHCTSKVYQGASYIWGLP